MNLSRSIDLRGILEMISYTTKLMSRFCKCDATKHSFKLIIDFGDHVLNKGDFGPLKGL
jgi:hypothetical protein